MSDVADAGRCVERACGEGGRVVNVGRLAMWRFGPRMLVQSRNEYIGRRRRERYSIGWSGAEVVRALNGSKSAGWLWGGGWVCEACGPSEGGVTRRWMSV